MGLSIFTLAEFRINMPVNDCGIFLLKILSVKIFKSGNFMTAGKFPKKVSVEFS